MRMKGKERPSPWDGDWEVRVCQRINELGYGAYLDYLQARRGVSYDALAAELSKDENAPPVAPVQLEHLHAQSVSPAERRDAILDSFVRFVRGPFGRNDDLLVRRSQQQAQRVQYYGLDETHRGLHRSRKALGKSHSTLET